MARYIITHNSKIPLISESYNYIARTDVDLPVAGDLWYDASTGNFMINRAKSGSDLILDSGTFSYGTYSNLSIVLSNSGPANVPQFRTNDSIGSYETTTFVVGIDRLDMLYNYGTTGSTTNRGQIRLGPQSVPYSSYINSRWSEDPNSSVYQVIKQINISTTLPNIISFTSKHSGAWPGGLDNMARLNGVTQSSTTVPGNGMDNTSSPTSLFKFIVYNDSSAFEVIHYYRKLTDSEIKSIERYLQIKWAISI